VSVIFGGSNVKQQIAELKRCPEVVVCTPGRMIDMLTANSGRVTNLRRCTYVVSHGGSSNPHPIPYPNPSPSPNPTLTPTPTPP
jgi:hypothetical protein